MTEYEDEYEWEDEMNPSEPKQNVCSNCCENTLTIADVGGRCRQCRITNPIPKPLTSPRRVR